jgi:hypothetical protein
MGASFPSGFYFMIWNCITHVLVYGYYFLKETKAVSKEILMKLSFLSCIVTLMECFLVMLQSWMGIFKRTSCCEQTTSLAFGIQGVYFFTLLCLPNVIQDTLFSFFGKFEQIILLQKRSNPLFRRIKVFSTQLKRI